MVTFDPTSYNIKVTFTELSCFIERQPILLKYFQHSAAMTGA